MTIWILNQNLTSEEENTIRARSHLRLPFDGLPDLRHITSPGEARQMLQLLYPDEPPEALTRRQERFWSQFMGVGKEDILAVPLPTRRELALAEVTGPYEYAVGEDGSDQHLIPVKWHDKPVRYMTLTKHKELYSTNLPMMEVTNQEARVLIRDRLPHRYNRFAKWKWLLLLMFGMGLVRMFTHPPM